MSNPNSTRRLLLQLAVIASVTLAACGGKSDGGTTSSPTAIKTQANTVTPALGATYNADVYVYAADGLTLLGQGKTDGTTGKSNVTLSNYTPGTPVIVKVVVGPGASYYDENKKDNVTIAAGTAPFSMLSILPKADANQDFSANPLTNMAAKFAGITADNLGTSALTTSLSADKIYEGVAKTNLALGLPTSTNILAPVIPATKDKPNPNGTLSNLLVVMATAPLGQASALSTTNDNPITRALKLAAAIKTDGTIETTKVSAFTDLNAALKSQSNLGLAIVAAITDSAQLQQSANTAKDVVSKSITTFTGSTTGAN
jgi:hypothetical protein